MSGRARALMFAVPFLGFLLLTGFLFKSLGNDPSKLPSALVGKPFPSFRMPALQDPQETLTNGSLPDGPFLLNVWATWCPSCYVEHPKLNRLAKEGFTIVGLNYKDERPAALRYLKKHGDPYTAVLFDERGDLAIDLGVYGAPETFLVDADGQIRYRFAGVVNDDTWVEELLPMWTLMIGDK